MSINIKEKQMEILMCEFTLLSKTIMTQIMMVDKLLKDKHIDSLYQEIEANEIIIDRLEVKIREEVVFSIFKFNPIASDLRQIIAYQDMAYNLERVGDMLLNITHRIKRLDLSQGKIEEMYHILTAMMKRVEDMIRISIISFTNRDATAAYKVIEMDDKVDELFHDGYSKLQDIYSEKNIKKEDIANIINMSTISYNLERIGDSATNIAESVIFITDGKDIRHGEPSNE